jgi:hypothetical protein
MLTPGEQKFLRLTAEAIQALASGQQGRARDIAQELLELADDEDEAIQALDNLPG